MKNVIIFLIFNFSLRGQGIEIIYEAKDIMDPALETLMPGIQESDITYRLSLKINNEKSIYNKDSIFVRKKDPRMKGGFMGQTIFKDYHNNSYVEFGAKYDENTAYIQSLDNDKLKRSYKWAFPDSEKFICGVRCKKATSGNSIAWYSVEHMYKDGPGHGVYSLPGLVLEFQTSTFFYKAIEIKPFWDIIELPTNLKVSESEHLILKDITAPQEFDSINYLSYSKIQFNKWVSLPSLKIK